MKRQELEALGLEKEVIDGVMKIHGADIEAKKLELETLKTQIEDKSKTIEELTEASKKLDSTSEEVKTLQAKLDEYQTNETKRKEETEQAQKESEMKQRFDALLGENKWFDDDIAKGRYNAFKDEINKPENQGKGDADLFEVVTKDRNCFVNPQRENLNLPANGTIGDKKIEDMSYNEYKAFRKGTK